MNVWVDRDGKSVSGKEFLSRWKSGVEGITPLQQTKTSLWASLPIFAGILWGLVVTFMSKTYWLTLILCGALPLQLISFLGQVQKYIALKRVEVAMRDMA